ncbi:methenyltetrahydrofolate cyclohydrolase /5,10-methylenetetrahydrofolate dehydrogenase (NADP+) [Quadrisphaera granulorum]|uniref:Bifunctional protein FolD n=1 Tax=Quadrisphaera granulorum TaxID=317664 RepID=A0A316ABX5_9ACTN|nr:bifunctional 5,10-methylenetetrahydrofolate dehydrogenase/5,10-methenyltetrahydrofolate cyclohydrolase [Quadrisphaera granulorum]PWJ54374.1 methenyltetrahydrofolate cyclohydrolase /5,10-methylenetetrahydrofolate dehydrogenase (NADP+) [Quadrisphaera granulorum]SZE96146.1 methenyltetrahydrofolate cyclohydrolase /5,10-methylenetetrahydrofolate dehydrogenase (NADP+) [Quadrisphaera granulorum]
MTAQLIDGTTAARELRTEVADGVRAFVADGGRPSGLATVLVGDDAASQVYVRSKQRACVEAGMVDHHRHLPGDVTQEQAGAVLDELAADPEVSGVLPQLPLPAHLDADALLARIPALKDVDGLTTESAGLLAQGRAGRQPCTPAGVVHLLDRTGVQLRGAEAVVVGRSVLVGRPMAQLLLQRDATVTLCHSRTRDLEEVCRRADVLVVAAGIPGLVGADAVKPGAVVVDVGIHRVEGGLTGDVDGQTAASVAGWLTPVPGGVGPMTIAVLLANTLQAARLQRAAHAG